MATLLHHHHGDVSRYYRNAKVVLVGDTGVGKSGLGLVLSRQDFYATESTHGRHVWTFQTEEQTVDNRYQETRETLLWDLAGQPGYRLIHQMYLHEIAVALVVFDARSETDPLAGVRHWERALRQAQERQGDRSIPLKKLLIVARADRGGIAVSRQRIDVIMDEMGFDSFFETSAKEGWQIPELAAAIREGIAWDLLPQVTSTHVFHTIKQFLLEEKQTGSLLLTADDLFRTFCRAHAQESDAELRRTFDTCIGRLENRDLIRRMSFGGYVLLQPELLDAYASAMINAARYEPDGLGSIAEEDALIGRFAMPTDIRIADTQQERLVLLATVEELLAYELVIRESADDGRYLVFPSQFNRDWEDAPDPEGKAVVYTFEGPVQSIYATLAVRLTHSGRFETVRTQMWRNAAVYTANIGGTCGIYLQEFAEARGRLTLFFTPETSVETRYQFEEYVQVHLQRRAIQNTIQVRRSFLCTTCGTSVPDAYATGRIERGWDWINCGVCDTQVFLTDPKQQVATRYPSSVSRMDDAADEARDYGVWLTSTHAEVQTHSFLAWAGDQQATLALVFTDVVGSTDMEYTLGDEGMNAVRAAHFTQTRKLLKQYDGREVKTTGDGFLAAFRAALRAFDFAVALQAEPGHAQVAVRAGIHVGPTQIVEGDIYGSTVNFAARVSAMATGAEIWVSNRAKQDIDLYKAFHHRALTWQEHAGCELQGFPDKYTLWSVSTSGIRHVATASDMADDPVKLLQHKLTTGRYDVFLCHNSEDKATVTQMAERLRRRGILPWLEERESRLGTPWQETLAQHIGRIVSMAIFTSPNGIGPWQDPELMVFIRQFMEQSCPMVLLIPSELEGELQLPEFLHDVRTVDFRVSNPDPFEQLVKQITVASG